MPNKEPAWNRCDVCGRYIAFADFEDFAVRALVRHDAESGLEEYETLCPTHADGHPATEDDDP